MSLEKSLCCLSGSGVFLGEEVHFLASKFRGKSDICPLSCFYSDNFSIFAS